MPKDYKKDRVAKKPTKAHHINFHLLVSSLVIIAFGLVMLTSASQVLGLDNFGDPYYYFKHQSFFGILPGIILLLIVSQIPYTVWQKFAVPIFIFSIILLLLVFVPELGFSHGGAKRWIVLGSTSIQPAEIVKLAVILFFASWFAKKQEIIGHFKYTFLPFLVYLGVIVLLIALQPDIGTLSVILLIAIAMYFVAGIKPKHLALLMILGMVSFGVLIKAAPYRLDRITAFLNPQSDTLGISYQINQSLLAIGSGGILGQGLGQSKQKYLYLPEVVGDSIFAVIAEELGFIVTTLFIGIYLYFIIIGFRISTRAPDLFGKLVATGITTWFAYQSLVNMGAMVNILPLTGLPLPFVSYGSSSLLVSMAALGILINISKYEIIHHKDRKP